MYTDQSDQLKSKEHMQVNTMYIIRPAVVLLISLTSLTGFGQYKFSKVHEAGCTEVKNQQRTGTCWSFATCSFLESELMRMGKGEYDLSEMFVVQNIYRDKARNYVLRQGKANFSQGSLSHDFIRSIARRGIVPEVVYDGRDNAQEIHNHGEMVSALKGMLDGVIGRGSLSDKWDDAFNAVLEVYLGAAPDEFIVDGKKHTPGSFAKSLGLNPANYLYLTSFNHHPFYESFVLEIPDNYSNQAYTNLPLEELESVVDHAIENGYTVAWDGDVSEKGFSRDKNIAVLPIDASDKDMFEEPIAEIDVNQANRQAAFESYATTDDHLMHIVGIYKDQNGNKYYKVKNSWGAYGAHEGFLYMSAPYFRMKTVAITVNKNSVPEDITKKIEF